MAEITLDVHDSNFEFDLRCEFDVIPHEELIRREIEKFKKEHPVLFEKLENDLRKLKEKQGG